ncbi:MAG: hypothetical protein DRN71_00215 [Candidatus Nanohalarchaeota archaeon]|nr:MAG: hypothetical protein DRN71_00215 [Candidatus Nanohaloarchaeota archaeon]
MPEKAAKKQNKIIENISKKTIGKSADTVADYIDLLSQMISEYLNQRYKIERKVEDIKSAAIQILFLFKREFVKTILETLFLVTGIFALIGGVVMLMSRYIPLDILLIGYGFIVTLAVLLRMKLKV